MFEHLFAERGLSLDRLKTLIEVAKAGSIAAAARGDSGTAPLVPVRLSAGTEPEGAALTLVTLTLALRP